jgi:hypothetical protein
VNLPGSTVCTGRGNYCLGFWSRGAPGRMVIVKSHCRHFQVSSIGTDECDLLLSMVILQRGQIFSLRASTTMKSYERAAGEMR